MHLDVGRIIGCGNGEAGLCCLREMSEYIRS